MLKREKCLNQHVRVDRRSAALDMSRFAPTHECALVDPHGQAASCDQPCVVLRPVPDSIDPFRLPTFAFVLAHLPAKYRESTQFLPKLTEAAPRPSRVNVTRRTDRHIYATTPQRCHLNRLTQAQTISANLHRISRFSVVFNSRVSERQVCLAYN